MKNRIIGAFVGAFCLCAGAANAAVVINIDEVGSDLVVSWDGSFDLAATLGKDADRRSALNDLWGFGAGGIISRNLVLGDYDDYNFRLTSSPSETLFTSIVSNGTVVGDDLLFEVAGGFKQFWVPDGYVSGQDLSGSNTFANASLASVGATLGSFTWTWENNGVSDGVTVNIGSVSAVPLPATGLLLLGALGGLAASRRRQSI